MNKIFFFSFCMFISVGCSEPNNLINPQKKEESKDCPIPLLMHPFHTINLKTNDLLADKKLKIKVDGVIALDECSPKKELTNDNGTSVSWIAGILPENISDRKNSIKIYFATDLADEDKLTFSLEGVNNCEDSSEVLFPENELVFTKNYYTDNCGYQHLLGSTVDIFVVRDESKVVWGPKY